MDSSSVTQQIYHKGAEAEISSTSLHELRMIAKHRVAKKYRSPLLDSKIRRERTISEAFILHEAKRAGVRVPSVVRVDLDTNTIIMTRVNGPVLRECLDQMSAKDAKKMFRTLGHQIAMLHAAGIVHGDLTTSNVILAEPDRPFLVDFGMSRRSAQPEDRGVDLHLMWRSVSATHNQNGIALSKQLFEGYKEVAGTKMAQSTLAKTREIARRGRYFAIR